MTNQHMKEAGELQAMTRASEAEKETQYSVSEIRRAIMHTREDAVLMVSLLDSLNRQAASIRGLLGLIAILSLISLFL